MVKRITALSLWALLVAAPGLSAEFEADDPDDEKQPEVKSPEVKKPDDKKPIPVKAATTPKSDAAKKQQDYEEYGPWQVKVPHEYRGHTFKLRIGDEVIDLDKEEITLKGSDFREKVDLVDDTGRLMSSDTIYVDPYIFDYVEERNWRVSLYFGGASVNGSKFRSILQDNWLKESTLDLEYQPSPLGVMVTFAGQSSEQEHDFGVTSTYESNQTRIAATFEWVPMKNGNAFFRKLHFLSYGGILFSRDTIKIQDDLIGLEDKSQSTGGIIGNDFMFPMWKFWVNVRAYVSYHPIKFEDFDFEQQSVQRGALIGGSYAF